MHVKSTAGSQLPPQDNRGMLALETGCVQLFPGGGTVFPFPMHSVYAAQHSRKPVLAPVHSHQILAVLGGRLPKIGIPEYLPNALTKKLHTFAGIRLADVEVLVEHVGRTSVSQLPDRCSALLNGRVARSTNRILSHPEI